MKRILRYRVTLSDQIQLRVPKGSKFLTFGMSPAHPRQIDDIDFWFEVPEGSMEDELRTYFIHGTGHTIPYDEAYIMTYCDIYNPFVWHLYEKVTS